MKRFGCKPEGKRRDMKYMAATGEYRMSDREFLFENVA
jgi:hypothetical protein